MLPTFIELCDVNGKPKIRKDLPGPLRLGDRIRLGFRLQRVTSGRTEQLEVLGEFRVSAVGFDAVGAPRQIIQVEAVGKTPTWRSVKKQPVAARRMAPARFDKTEVT